MVAAGIYMIYRSWDQLERLADDSANLLGFILLFGILALAMGRVLRS